MPGCPLAAVGCDSRAFCPILDSHPLGLLLVTHDTLDQRGRIRLLLVARQAPTHVHIYHRPNYAHLSDITVTALAVQSTRNNVGPVAEIDESRQAVDSLPLDRVSAFPGGG